MMRNLVKSLFAVATTAAALVGAATPAQAQLFYSDTAYERGTVEPGDALIGIALPGANAAGAGKLINTTIEFFLHAHRNRERLIPVTKVYAAPDRSLHDRPVRPLPVRQLDRSEGPVLLDGFRFHGISIKRYRGKMDRTQCIPDEDGGSREDGQDQADQPGSTRPRSGDRRRSRALSVVIFIRERLQ